MKPTSPSELMLIACTAVADPARPHLAGIYLDRDLPYAVSTDGHRMHATRRAHRADLAGSIVDTEIYQRSGRMVSADVSGDFPDWKAVVPRWRPTACVDLHIPGYVRKLKPRDRMPVTILTPGPEFNEGQAEVLLGYPQGEHVGGVPSVTLNLALLSNYAEQSVRLWLFDSKSPVVVTDTDIHLTAMSELFSVEAFSVVMPMRADRKSGLATAVSLRQSAELDAPAAEVSA